MLLVYHITTDLSTAPPSDIIKPMDTLTTVEKNKYTYKPRPKNKAFMEYWLTPGSETFGNVYRSGLKAGFSKTYATNLLNVAPKWLLTYIERADFTHDHIKMLLQNMATDQNLNSRSPADSNLKAIELLMKGTGMIDNKGTTTNVTLVQPILNGESIKQRVTVESKQTSDKQVEQA